MMDFALSIAMLAVFALSGGGIWRYDWEASPDSEDSPLLTAILIGKAKRADHVLIGTRISALHRALVSIFPELGDHISLRTDEDWTVTRQPRATEDGDQ